MLDNKEIQARSMWNKTMWLSIRGCSQQAKSYITKQIAYSQQVIDELKALND